MGFFDDVKRFLTGENKTQPVVNAVTNAVAGKGGPPGEDERLKQIRESQIKQAEDFKKNRPGIENDMMSGLVGQERRRLSSELTGVKSGFNNRGLLYSGLRQGAEAGAEANSASSLAQGRRGVTRDLNAAQDQLDKASLDTDLAQYKTQQQMQDQVFSSALENMRNSRAGFNSFAQAGGQVLGSYLGSRRK